MLNWLFSDPLPVGSEAPNFETLDDSGNNVKLSALKGRNVVLVFYPGDNTPVCTAQICEFRDRWEQAKQHNVLVYGVNPKGVASHAGFRAKQNLPFPLLVDDRQTIGAAYHADGLIVKRTVYLIGPDGAIRYARRGKPPAGEVLAAAG